MLGCSLMMIIVMRSLHEHDHLLDTHEAFRIVSQVVLEKLMIPCNIIHSVSMRPIWILKDSIQSGLWLGVVTVRIVILVERGFAGWIRNSLSSGDWLDEP
jgi:hypothetical protein